MKFLGMILKNVRRNPIRSFLTVASLGVSLSLAMVLISFSTINAEMSQSVREYNRIIVMSDQGFTQPVPIARLAEVAALKEKGVTDVTTFSWYGGKYKNEVMPFAQFGVEPLTFFKIYNEYRLPADQLKAWQDDKAGCVIGRKLASERDIHLGDELPLEDGVAPTNLILRVRGIFDGPSNGDLRACYFHWLYLDDKLKIEKKGGSGNAGVIVARCQQPGQMAGICKQIDEANASSDAPTKTQSEEAFAQMFSEMVGDFKWIIIGIGLAVGVSLLCVTANAMAMALRERTTEVAVLKAIGFGKSLVVSLILAESVLIAGIGGVLGAIGIKLFCDAVDISRFSSGFLPFFYIPWSTAIGGLIVSLAIGLFSGLFPAIQASRLSVVNGLRKVV
jgi:putative ABC transport system permease protein